MDAVTMSSEEFYTRVENYLESASLQYKKELEEFMESGSGSGSSSSDAVSDSVKNFKSKLGNVIATIKKRLLQLIRDLKIKYNETKLKSLKEKARKTEEKLKACKPIQNKKFELFDFSTWQKDIESCKSKIKNSKSSKAVEANLDAYKKKYKDKEEVCKKIVVTAALIVGASFFAGMFNGIKYNPDNIEKEIDESFNRLLTESSDVEDADLDTKIAVAVSKLIEDEIYISKKLIDEYDRVLNDIDKCVDKYSENMSEQVGEEND